MFHMEGSRKKRIIALQDEFGFSTKDALNVLNYLEQHTYKYQF